MKNQNGQSLLEIAVAIGIVAIVASAIAITTINGLRNSQFAQNQIQANKYAQEGLESVRTARERDCPIEFSSKTYGWTSKSSAVEIWGENLSSFSTESLKMEFTLSSSTTPYVCRLYHPTIDPDPIAGTIFKRQIFLDSVSNAVGGNNSDSIKVRSVVEWTDISGTHTSELTTFLGNY